MRFRLLPVLLAVATSALAGCQRADFFGPRIPVLRARLVLFGATDSPTHFPSAVGISGVTVFESRADIELNGSLFYDIVFDIEQPLVGGPRIRVIPVRQWVLAPTLSLPSVALRASNDRFESVNTVPTDGFTADSVLVVQPKQTFFVQTNRCLGFQSNQFSKIIVDSVDVATRRMALRVVTDPNCGQRTVDAADFPPL